MQSEQIIALNFYNAVISDNGMNVQEILENNSNLPVKIITGMLVIALEEKLLESVKAIMTHNTYSKNKILNKHLDVILCLAAKSNLLKELGITCH